VVRTYAPVGQTPILHEHLSRDHLSVISAITLEGKLLMMEQERSFKSQDVVHFFLRHLLRQIPGKLLVIWDGSPIHRGGGGQGLSGQRVVLAATIGAITRLRARSQPRRGYLEALEVRGAKERLLPEPLGVEGRAT
jgi:hypothetical protein